MTRTMYDAIDALSLPAGGDLYAGYVDGKWPSADAIQQRFPHALVVRIATNPATDGGVVGDGPPDNGDWAEWIGWVRRRRAARVDPTMNCSLSQWPAGRAAFASAGVAQPHWWIAHYSPDHTIPAGAVALQHTNLPGYDVSAVADYWPGVDPAPTAAPAALIEEDTMVIVAVQGQTTIWMLAGDRLWPIEGPAALDGYRQLGIPEKTISPATFAAIQADMARLKPAV